MGEVILKGIGVSRGIGIGTAVVLKKEELKIEHILVEEEETERKRFEEAVSSLKQKNLELSKQLSASVGEKDGQIIFKTDNTPLFAFSLEEAKEAGWTIVNYTYDLHHSEYAEGNIMTEYETKFSAKGNPINRMVITQS